MPEMTTDQRREFVLKTALQLPEVEESTAYGNPALRIQGKFMAGLSPDWATLSIKIDVVERDLLLEAEPHIYSVNEHVVRFSYVHVRVDAIGADDLLYRFKQAWRMTAPKRLLKEYAGKL